MLTFLQWVEEHFPEEAGVFGPQVLSEGASFWLRCYARPADLQAAGPILLRPWMLVYAANCGSKGLVEPDALLHM